MIVGVLRRTAHPVIAQEILDANLSLHATVFLWAYIRGRSIDPVISDR